MKQILPPLAHKYARAYLAVTPVDLTPHKITAYEAAAEILWQRRKAFTYLQNFPIMPAAATDLILSLLERYGLRCELETLIKLLARHKRLWLLSPILSATALLMRKGAQRPLCVVTSAMPLSQEQKYALESHTSSLWGTNTEIHYQEDSSLIAGIRLCSGFSRWEYSVARKLRLLHQKLLAGVDNG